MMMWLDRFRWSELVVTNNHEDYTQMVDKLIKAKISYREKVQYMGHGTRRGGTISGLGENQKYIYLYQVFVKKKDIEQAKYICTKG